MLFLSLFKRFLLEKKNEVTNEIRVEFSNEAKSKRLSAIAYVVN